MHKSITLLKKNWPFITIFILAFLTRFLFLSYPSETVFDEVYFGHFASCYFSHEYYFDIHPPLGKMMIAGFAKIFSSQINFNFTQVGQEANKNLLFLLRFLPVLFGALFVLLIYLFILKIGLSKKAAFLGSFLVLFDNAFLVQSRFILIDIFLLFFGFLSLYFFMSLKKSKKFTKAFFIYLSLSAFFAALSFSIKWTGLSFLGIILFFIFIDFLKKFNVKETLVESSLFIFIPFLVYLSIFAVHFKILTKSGPGDVYMSPAFQKTLSGNKIKENITPLSFSQKFIELNKKMYLDNENVPRGHPFSSKWYQWPFGNKPIWYWTKNINEKIASIYLLGNPLVWFLAFLSVLSSLVILLIKPLREKMPPLIYFLTFGYFLNLLPFIFVKRDLFLYHYLASLTFGILIFVFLYDRCHCSPKIYYGFLTAVLLVFLFLSPLSYGLPISSGTNHFYQLFIKFFS